MKKFVTPLIGPDGGFNFPHGLGATPQVIHAVLVCVNFDLFADFAIGDEIPIYYFTENGQTFEPGTVPFVGANSTNIFSLPNYFTVIGPNATTSWAKTVDNAQNQIGSMAHFNLRVYAYAF